MDVREGTIRFRFELRAAGRADRVPAALFAQLEGWRRVLRRVGLVGRDPARYSGFAFGNLSLRDPADAKRFFVTASQTIAAETLDPQAMPRIDHADLDTFAVDATGSLPPSSETLTHAAVYAVDPSTRCLFHVHCPEIWRHALELSLPATQATTAYGTPALATEVAGLLRRHRKRPITFVTPGHEDGVFTCGGSPDEVGASLLTLLARAVAPEAS
jgi:ribulose-5-phosphate 4-epimerase/fuculose-1-phosphate aldolase